VARAFATDWSTRVRHREDDNWPGPASQAAELI
jgi:hypothetical protein